MFLLTFILIAVQGSSNYRAGSRLARAYGEIAKVERTNEIAKVERANVAGCSQSEQNQSFGFGLYGTMTCQSFADTYGRAACSMISFTPCGCMCSGRAARAIGEVAKVERANVASCSQSELNQSFGFGLYGTMTCQKFADTYDRSACSMISFTPCGCMCPGNRAARAHDAIAKVERANLESCSQSELNQSFGFGMYGTMTCSKFADTYGRAACQMVSFTPCGCMC